jgi:hypothetical protein
MNFIFTTLLALQYSADLQKKPVSRDAIERLSFDFEGAVEDVFSNALSIRPREFSDFFSEPAYLSVDHSLEGCIEKGDVLNFSVPAYFPAKEKGYYHKISRMKYHLPALSIFTSVLHPNLANSSVIVLYNLDGSVNPLKEHEQLTQLINNSIVAAKKETKNFGSLDDFDIYLS